MNTGRTDYGSRPWQAPLQLYKLVVRDKNGKVQQVHECYRNDIQRKVLAETDGGFSVTVTRL